jgi:glyoxalase family protein
MMPKLTGIHHVTAVSARIHENHRFYTRILGLRLVKRSVNQDDVSAYHLFYADAVGTPGTDVTFFDWNMPRERRGTNSITRTSLRVGGQEALEWWTKHLVNHDVPVNEVVERDGRLILDFEDPEGQRLSLVDDGGHGPSPIIWQQSTVPAEFQIRGLGPIMISIPSLEATASVLTHALGMKATRTYPHPGDAADTVHVFEMNRGGPHAELHVAVQPGLPPSRLGAGGVHHVAFRIPDYEQYDEWAARLAELRIPNSGPVDRYYFRGLYFREPSGVLFELATDGPGFAVDEDLATLGEKVVLPPFLEGQRAEILANLKPID